MLWERYTEPARKVMLHADDWAIRLRSACITNEHILLGLLEETDTLTCRILSRLKVNISQLKSELGDYLKSTVPAKTPIGSPALSSPAKQVLIRAADEAKAMGDSHIDTSHLLLSLLREKKSMAAKFLLKHNVRYEDVRRELMAMRAESAGTKAEFEAMIAEKVGLENLTKAAVEGAFRPTSLWRKQRELLTVVMLKREHFNGLLLGNFETSLLFVQQFACDLASEEAIEPLKGRQLWKLNWGSLMLQEQEIEKAVAQILRKLRTERERPLLFIGTVRDAICRSDALRCAIQDGIVQCIAIADGETWMEFEKKHPEIASTFTIVNIPEPNEEQVLEWLNAHKHLFASDHRVSIDEAALESVVKIASEKFADRPMLAVAKDLLDTSCALVRMRSERLPAEVNELARQLGELVRQLEQARKSQNEELVRSLEQQCEELKKRKKEILDEWEKRQNVVTVSDVQEAAQLLAM